METSLWVEVASKLGIPATLALALIFVFGKGLVWAGREILVPMKKRHFEFLDKMERTQSLQTESLKDIKLALQAINEHLMQGETYKKGQQYG